MTGRRLVLDITGREARAVVWAGGSPVFAAIDRATGDPRPGDVVRARVVSASSAGPAFLSWSGGDGVLLGRHGCGEGETVRATVHQSPRPGKGAVLRRGVSCAGRFLILSDDGVGIRRSRHFSGPLPAEIAAALGDRAPAGFGWVLRRRAADAGLEALLAEAALLAERGRAALSAQGGAAALAPAQRLIADLAAAGGTIAVHPRSAALALRSDPWVGAWGLAGAVAPADPGDLADLEDALDLARQTTVVLPSGSRLTIEEGETATTIDVDRGSARGDAASVNRDAMVEAVRRMRLRRISGLVLVDVLRFGRSADAGGFVAWVRDRVGDDDMTCRVHGLTRAGLLEITRERRFPSLYEMQATRVEDAFGQRWTEKPEAAAFRALRAVRAARPAALRVGTALHALFSGPLAPDWAAVAHGVDLACVPSLAPAAFDVAP